MTDRIPLTEYFLMVAATVAKRSSWPGSTKVGAVAVMDKQIISTGYNGSPSGFTIEMDVDAAITPQQRAKLRKFYCHAEENCVVQAAKHGVRLNKSHIYCTHSPCLSCARIMVNAGVEEITYASAWDDEEARVALDLLITCGVLTSQYVPKP